MNHFYRKLNERFKDRRICEIFMIKIEGNVGVAPSSFSGSGKKNVHYKVMNALDVLHKPDVGNFLVDLLTRIAKDVNTAYLNVFHHQTLFIVLNIQFATHPTLEKLTDQIKRYCQLQEVIHRTHKLTYQYKFVCESLKLKVNVNSRTRIHYYLS